MKVSYRVKNTVRAVVAALIFLGLSWALLQSGSSPLPRLLNTGEIWAQSSRPGMMESLLFSSETAALFETSKVGEKYLPEWKSQSERMKKAMGGAYEWVAWGPWKTALRVDGPEPLIAVDAGLMAPLGVDIFRKAGFEEAEELDGNPALKRDFLTFVRAGDLWLLGSRKSVKQSLSPTRASVRADWNLGWDITQKYDVIVALSPGKLRDIVYPGRADEKTVNAINEWLDVNDWGGLLAYIDVDEKMMEARLNWLVGKDKPVSRLLAGIEKCETGGRWLHPDTSIAASLAAGEPVALWNRARRLYASRPIPSDFLWRAKEELEREVDFDVEKLLRLLGGRLGFVRFVYDGKPREIVFADARPGAGPRFRRMEEGIFGEWKSGYQGIPLRYMPRLLSYGITDNRLLVASEPPVVGDYVQGALRADSLAEEIRDVGEDVKDYPLAVAGRIPSAKSISDMEGPAGWFAAGITCDRGRMKALARLPLDAKVEFTAPWKPRLVSWGVGAGKVLGWIIAALSMGALACNGFSMSRRRLDNSEHGEEESES